MRFLNRALLAVSAILLALPLMGAAPADVLTVQAPSAHAGTMFVQDDTDRDEDGALGRTQSEADQEATEKAVASNFVTINRWKSATGGMSSNLGGWDLQNAGAAISRSTVQGFMMSAGNLSWDLAANLTQFSASTNLVDGMVWHVDWAMATVLKAFMGDNGSPNLLGIISIIAILVVIFATMKQTRGAELAKRLVAVFAITGLFWVTAAQLTSSTSGPLEFDQSNQQDYQPAPPSPSWMIMKTTQVMDQASSLSSAIALEGFSAGTTWTSGDRALGCDKYLNALEADEKALGETLTTAGQNQYQMRTIVDRLWRESGLRTWVNAQYGSNNKIKYNVFCYHLDVKSEAVSPSQAYTQIRSAGAAGGISDMQGFLNAGESGKASESAIVNPSSSEAEMSAMLGWGICNWTKSGKSGENFDVGLGGYFNGFHDSANQSRNLIGLGKGDGGADGGWSTENVAELCNAWRTASIESNWIKDDNLKAFYVPGYQSQIGVAVDTITESPDGTMSASFSQSSVSDFLSSMIGTGAGAGIMSTLAYAMLSPVGTLPISLIAVAKLIAEVMLVFTVATLMLSMLGGLFTRSPFGEKLLPALKQMVMLAVLAVGVGVVMSFMLVISNALTLIGITLLENTPLSGSLITTAWAALSPLITIIGMGYVWKKVFKAPSPFSVGGLGAWMKGSPAGAAALGSAVGSGVGSFAGNRLARAGRGMARSAGNRAMENVTDGIMGRKKGGKKRSGMTAGGTEGEGTGDKIKLSAEQKAEAREQKQVAKIERARERAQLRDSKPSIRRALGLNKSAREAFAQKLDFEGKPRGLGRSVAWLNHSAGLGAVDRGTGALTAGASKARSGFARANEDARAHKAAMLAAGATGTGAALSMLGTGVKGYADVTGSTMAGAAQLMAPVALPATVLAAAINPAMIPAVIAAGAGAGTAAVGAAGSVAGAGVAAAGAVGSFATSGAAGAAVTVTGLSALAGARKQAKEATERAQQTIDAATESAKQTVRDADAIAKKTQKESRDTGSPTAQPQEKAREHVERGNKKKKKQEHNK